MNTKLISSILAAFILLSVQSFAQDLSQVFFPSKEGTILTYTNVQGSTVLTQVDSVASISGTFNEGSAVVVSRLLDADGSTKQKFNVPVTFKQNEVIVNMYSLMLEVIDSMTKQMAEAEGKEAVDITKQIEVNGETCGIPAVLEKGMKLPDYDVEIKIAFMKMKFKARDRSVSGEETITTPAGTFKCFVVEESMKVSMAFLNEKTRTKTWYAYGIGEVRQETYDSKGKLTDVSELVSKSIP